MRRLTTISNNGRVFLHSLFLLLAATVTVRALTSSVNMQARLPTVSPLSGLELRDLVLETSRMETRMVEEDYDNDVTSSLSASSSSSLDLHGIMWMEHINLIVGKKELAEYFYLDVLGLTRDGGKSFHVNLGQQQFHLAESKGDDEPPQCIAGSIGLAFPNLTTLRERLVQADRSGRLKDTAFKLLFDIPQSSSTTTTNDEVEDMCLTFRGPWGNIFHCYSVVPSPDQDRTMMFQTPQKMTNLHSDGGDYGPRMAVREQPGIRFVEVVCPKKKAPAVARFYRDLLGCSVQLVGNDSIAIVSVGPGVHLVFSESNDDVDDRTYTDATQAMQGVHLCFYADNFKGLYNKLSQRNLIWTNPRFVHLDTCDTFEEAVRSRTLRFKDIIDPDLDDDNSEKILLELEHETRPLRHGQYMKVPAYEPK